MKKRLLVGVLAAGIVTLLARLPLSWIGNAALPDNVIPKPVFSGTVWKGFVSGIPQIGPISLNASLVKFFKGQPPLTFSSQAPYMSFSGFAGLGGKAALLIEGDMRGMSSFDRRFAGLEGRYTLDIPEIVIGQDCRSANGVFTTDVLRRNQRLWQWQGPELSGPVTCEEGDIVLTITGADTIQTIQAIVRIDPTGTYKAEVDVKTGDSRADLILPLFGFQKSGRDYRLLEAGRWQ